MIRRILVALTLLTITSCSHEGRMEGSWFVEYFVNDLKTTDFILVLNEDGSGEIDGGEQLKWAVNKKDLILTIGETDETWENNRNRKNQQFYLRTDSLGDFLRMELDRIKE